MVGNSKSVRSTSSSDRLAARVRRRLDRSMACGPPRGGAASWSASSRRRCSIGSPVPPTVLLGLCVRRSSPRTLPLTVNSSPDVSFTSLGARRRSSCRLPRQRAGDFFSGPEAGNRAASLAQASHTTARTPWPARSLTLISARRRMARSYASVAIIAAIADGCCVVPRLSWHRPRHVARTGDREAYRLVARAPGRRCRSCCQSTVRACTIQAGPAFLAATSRTVRAQDRVEIVATFRFVGRGAAVVATI